MKSKEFALSILEKVRLIQFAESLGGVETLITYPVTQTHADVPKDILEKNGVTDRVLRMSVGLEAAEDLIAELDDVFKKSEEELGNGKKS
jgi:cystathionine gamma-synthase